MAHATAGDRPAGAAWVERFLLPHLARRFAHAREVSCLQVSPDDPTEAEKLRELGYRCDVTEPTAAVTLVCPDSSYDFAFTGRYPLRAPDHSARMVLAREFHRVLRSGGSLLLAIGNRACPVDLTRNGPFLHGPAAGSCLSLDEIHDVFVRQAGFETVVPLGVEDHFGWGRLPPLLRPLGRVMNAYWRVLVTPSRRWLYSSPLNPTLLVWLNKS